MERQSRIEQIASIIGLQTNGAEIVVEPRFFDEKLGAEINPVTVNAAFDGQGGTSSKLIEMGQSLKLSFPDIFGPYLQVGDNDGTKLLRAFFKDSNNSFETLRIQLFPNREIVIQKTQELADRIGGKIVNEQVS